jgi:hypothetical protein
LSDSNKSAHSLRHSAISTAIRNGASLPQVQAMARHTSVNTTMIYFHQTGRWIANFIWNIADDVLRGVYVRGKYRDVILPMTVIRRLDAVLEGDQGRRAGNEERLDKAGIATRMPR